jgi:hypothetical protein
MSITYEAVLDLSEHSVQFLSGLLHDEQIRRGTRKNTRALSTFKQAVLVLRWFFDGPRMTALARDNGISLSTAYDYRDEGIAVLAARLSPPPTAGHYGPPTYAPAANTT